MYKLFIDCFNDKIGVYQNKELVEVYEKDLENLEGNIYVAKVKNIIDDMNVVFCNIGIKKDGMLQFDNINGYNNVIRISDFIDKKEFRLVQVFKNCVEDKGPKLTENIKIAGKNVVVMFDKGVYFSDKLSESFKRLVLSKIGEQKYGVIIRSSAVNNSIDDLFLEINKLTLKLDDIVNEFNNSDNVKCLYTFGGIVNKLINDFYNYDLKIEINSNEVCNLFSKVYSDLDVKFVNKELGIKFKEKIFLKSRGYILIQNTFAGTMIDVNSGRSIRNKIDGVFLNTNLEAVKEICRQIRLRDLSGIIIIDFINLKNDFERDQVMKFFKECVKSDRGKVNVVDFTKLRVIGSYKKTYF